MQKTNYNACKDYYKAKLEHLIINNQYLRFVQKCTIINN